jgi:hypothetical protein
LRIAQDHLVLGVEDQVAAFLDGLGLRRESLALALPAQEAMASSITSGWARR